MKTLSMEKAERSNEEAIQYKKMKSSGVKTKRKHMVGSKKYPVENTLKVGLKILWTLQDHKKLGKRVF